MILKKLETIFFLHFFIVLILTCISMLVLPYGAGKFSWLEHNCLVKNIYYNKWLMKEFCNDVVLKK